MNNFTLIEEKFLTSEQAQALVYEHNTTKAKVLVLKNEDDNKLFSIGFRTPPKDSSGLNHILEHTVLNGSKKYRTREPFMDMIKSSLQTFLNAMTYPDKTIYPVASRNTKDFENLMDVYLDAVFNPIVTERKEVFLQEGWRYHLDINEAGQEQLSYKGVVYNEMKGAMSGAEDQAASQIYEHLFPDTIYSLNSGGDPYEMTNLTYDDFINYYEHFYHPSNSYIFLYGDVDYEKYLSYIHKDYLNHYDYKEIDSSLKDQQAFVQAKEMEASFSTTKPVKENSNMISYSVVTASSESAYDRLMNQLLRAVLIASESSPLKVAINELNIVDDIFSMSSTAKQSSFVVFGKNIKAENKTVFVEAIEKTLREIVENGLNTDMIRSMLNNMAFSLKEKGGNATKGIEYLSRAYSTWLYDGSPIDGLDISQTLDYIQENIDKGIFEKYIQEKILDNPHKLIMLHKPEFGLNDKKDEVIKKDLQAKLEAMTEEERQALRDQKQTMDIFQNKEDTAEEKATIPQLSLDDVDVKFDPISRELIQDDKVTYLLHDLPTSGIDYLNFIFNIDHIDPKDTAYLALLSDVLGNLSTKNYDYQSLFTKVYLETGGISYNVGNYSDYKTDELFRTLTVSTKVFSDNIENAMTILEEILFNTKFDEEKRLKELIKLSSSRMEMSLLDYGHVLMMNRVRASKFASEKLTESVNGIDAYLFYKDLKEANLTEVLEKLKSLYKDVFNKNSLIVDVASDFTNKTQLESSIRDFVTKLNTEKKVKIDYEFSPQIKKEAFITSTDVSYVSIGENLKAHGYDYKGSASVLSNLLSNAYLYNEIRAKGGAYGAGMTITNKNAFATYSYRDPNIKSTLDIYNNLPQMIDSLNLDQADLNAFIIGAIGRFDPPLTERGKARRDLDLYLADRDYKLFENYVEEAKAATPEGLKAMASILESAIDTASLAVLTSKTKLEENKELFDKIIDLR